MKFKRIIGLLGALLVISTSSLTVYADSTDETSITETSEDNSLVYEGEFMPIVTIGADLSVEQRDLILQFFAVNESMNVTELTITNEDERKYLEGVVDDSVIGTRTLSCAFVMPTSEGGINVKTANLNWVTDSMIANALLTAGIENCNVVATAPFEVSGTGALTGILKGYESSTGSELEDDKKQQATEELVISAELTEENEEDKVLEMLNDLKQQAINGELSDNVEDTINSVAEKYGVTVPEKSMNKLILWLEKFEQLTYDIEKFSEAIDKLNNSLQGLSDTVSEGKEEAKNWLQAFFEAIANFFKKLFGIAEEKLPEVQDTAEDFFSQFNTDVFEFDGTIGDSSVETTIE